jgi:hypothetical protein
VFFWLAPRRLEQLLAARGNRSRPHDVVTVDTASLVRRHRPGHAAIAELAVVGGVPDIAGHVVSVQRISEADSSLARPAVGRP